MAGFGFSYPAMSNTGLSEFENFYNNEQYIVVKRTDSEIREHVTSVIHTVCGNSVDRTQSITKLHDELYLLEWKNAREAINEMGHYGNNVITCLKHIIQDVSSGVNKDGHVGNSSSITADDVTNVICQIHKEFVDNHLHTILRCYKGMRIDKEGRIELYLLKCIILNYLMLINNPRLELVECGRFRVPLDTARHHCITEHEGDVSVEVIMLFPGITYSAGNLVKKSIVQL